MRGRDRVVTDLEFEQQCRLSREYVEPKVEDDNIPKVQPSTELEHVHRCGERQPLDARRWVLATAACQCVPVFNSKAL